MIDTILTRAHGLIERQHFGEALELLRPAIDQDPSQWNAWYLAGQCHRFLGNHDIAIHHLSRAADLRRDDPSVFLALGIAFQLNDRFDDAVEAFGRAIDIDPDFALAYNSLALTQKKRGDLANASHNYDAGVLALTRRFAKGLTNDRDNPILKHRDTEGLLWLRYAIHSAMYLAAGAEGVDHYAWPTGDQAAEEERTERHAGLYWTDVLNEAKQTMRLFLPNYYCTFREYLKRDATYSTLLANRSSVLESLGEHEEARRHAEEADEFTPHQ